MGEGGARSMTITAGRLTFGSGFTGVAGLDIAVERVFDALPLWHAEPEPYAASVLKRHYPGVPNFGRIERVKHGIVTRPDIICGGFPCQDISRAGSGAGLDGERSGLWWELARVIRELGPWIVVLENVAALLDRGLDRILGEMADLGFDAEWSCFRAADVGAPHLRRRVFILAVHRGISNAQRDALRLIGERNRKQRSEPGARVVRHDGEEVGDTNSSGRAQQRQQAQAGVEPFSSGASGAMAHGHGRQRQRGSGLQYVERPSLRDHAHRCCEAPRWPPGRGDEERVERMAWC